MKRKSRKRTNERKNEKQNWKEKTFQNCERESKNNLEKRETRKRVQMQVSYTKRPEIRMNTSNGNEYKEEKEKMRGHNWI